MDASSIVAAGIAAIGGLGFIGLIYFTYRQGKQSQINEQGKSDVKQLKEQLAEASKSRPTSTDDRNSMHDGTF